MDEYERSPIPRQLIAVAHDSSKDDGKYMPAVHLVGQLAPTELSEPLNPKSFL